VNNHTGTTSVLMTNVYEASGWHLLRTRWVADGDIGGIKRLRFGRRGACTGVSNRPLLFDLSERQLAKLVGAPDQLSFGSTPS